MRKTGIKLDMHMESAVFILGSPINICSGKNTDYYTVVDFALDVIPSNDYLGVYELGSSERPVQVQLARIDDESSDPIMRIGGDMSYGVPGCGETHLPLRAFTDNRGRYPCVLARIAFPYRLASWIDPEHESCMRMDYDYKEAQITGFPRSEDKIEALRALHTAIPQDWPAAYRPSYDEVTVYTQTYYLSGRRLPALTRLVALDSPTAYEDAVQDYFFGTSGADQLHRSVEENATKANDEINEIKEEGDLLRFVVDNAFSLLQHHIQNRRWIDPFWDGTRKVASEATTISVPCSPKSETEIQPTLYVILHMALSRYGIQIARETDEGVGSLDFRCFFTTKSGKPLTIGIEFKIAHHKQIQKGIRRQLPAYLEAIQSRSGIFVVMWFKDSKCESFCEPRMYDLEGFEGWLSGEAEQVAEDLSLNLEAIVLDASVRPSASNR